MSGYHNDQFFRLNSADSGETSTFTNIGNNGAGWALRGADNPNFIYPDRTIRTEDQRGLFNQSLKRGYIRSLSTYTGGGDDLDIRKCQFQFNPGTIGQHVESAQSTLNFAQMDPGQYSVPRATSVNFSFSLLFDRSMEMNNVRVGAPAPDAINPWQSGDPGQVGVLRDLAAFYGVIGQSIGLDQAAYMEKSVTDALIAESKTVTSDTRDADLAKALANVPGFIRANAANSAFLLPTPVRVVFSSLYIVEGFVTNTEVAMTKFSTAMVPMQCALTVTMEAKYIGFAQKNTFLTWSIEKRAEMIQAEEQAAVDRTAALYTAFSSSLPGVRVGISPGLGTVYDGATPVPTSESVDYQMSASSPGSQTYIRFPVAKSKPRTSDPVVTLFDDGDVTDVSVSGRFAIYGPFDDLSYFQGKSSDVIKAAVLYPGPPPFEFQGRVAPPGTNTSATSASAWRTMVDNYATSISPTDKSLSKATGTYNTAKWYGWEAEIKVTVRAGGSSFEGTGTSWSVLPPGSGAVAPVQTVALTWPAAPVVSATTPSVPASNATTNPPAPGGVSNVGNDRRDDRVRGAQ